MKRFKILLVFVLLLISSHYAFSQSASSLSKDSSDDDKKDYASVMNLLLYSLSNVDYYQNMAIAYFEYENLFLRFNYKDFLDNESEIILNEFEELIKSNINKKKLQLINNVSLEDSEFNRIMYCFNGFSSVLENNDYIDRMISLYSNEGISSYFNYRKLLNRLIDYSSTDAFAMSLSDKETINRIKVKFYRNYCEKCEEYEIDSKYIIRLELIESFIRSLDTYSDDSRSRSKELESKSYIFSDFPPFWYQLAVAYQEFGDNENARASYIKLFDIGLNRFALEKDLLICEAYKNLIVLERLDGNLDKVNAYIDKIDHSFSPYFSSVNEYSLARIYFSLGELDKAQEHFDHVIEKGGVYSFCALYINKIIDCIKYKNDTSPEALSFCEVINLDDSIYLCDTRKVKELRNIIRSSMELSKSQNKQIKSLIKTEVREETVKDYKMQLEASEKWIASLNKVLKYGDCVVLSLPADFVTSSTVVCIKIDDGNYIEGVYIPYNGSYGFYYFDLPFKKLCMSKNLDVKFSYNSDNSSWVEKFSYKIGYYQNSEVAKLYSAIDKLSLSPAAINYTDIDLFLQQLGNVSKDKLTFDNCYEMYTSSSDSFIKNPEYFSRTVSRIGDNVFSIGLVNVFIIYKNNNVNHFYNFKSDDYGHFK